MKVSRKEFLGVMGKAAVAVAGVSLIGACGSDSGGSGNPDAGGGGPDCAANGTISTIATNHGHTLTVSKADVAAGVDKTYDITGTAGHAHSVTLTAADFTKLQGAMSAMETSTVGAAHTHVVTVACA